MSRHRGELQRGIKVSWQGTHVFLGFCFTWIGDFHKKYAIQVFSLWILCCRKTRKHFFSPNIYKTKKGKDSSFERIGSPFFKVYLNGQLSAHSPVYNASGFCKPRKSPRYTWHVDIHIICLLATFHMRRWRWWRWRCYSKQGCRRADGSVIPCLGHLRIFPSIFLGRPKLSFLSRKLDHLHRWSRQTKQVF